MPGMINQLMQQVMGGPEAWGIGSNPYGGPTDPSPGGAAGYRAPYGKQGPGSRGYYRGVPTAWNAEITEPTYYNYTGDPDPAKMARRPWDPSFWDPNLDDVPGSRGRVPVAAIKGRQDRGRMSMDPRFAAWVSGQMGGR